ncbi:unnamed protein product [Brassica oleracea var. botrytis]|uniref:(rape) hypothetical protein n=1 Tax=Brassica napus TaxID=3708 RepID=A0A816R3D6_BRANA|nr:unnamed protein product [Brassica napus]
MVRTLLLIQKLFSSGDRSIPLERRMSNVFVGSALIHKCGFVSEAFRVFDSMPEKNLVSWKAMIIWVRQGMGFAGKELKLTYRMEAARFEVDDYIFATIISTCGDVDLDEAESSATPCYLETS